MKKQIKKYIIATALFCGCCYNPLHAQVVYVEEDEKNVVVDDEDGDEEQIEVPESMLQNIDSLLMQYHVEKYLKISDDCNMRDVNPYFPPEVYIERLSRMPTIIEMPYNEIVQKFIDRYATKLSL